MDQSTVSNAKITHTMLDIEDHGILTAWLTLDFGDSSGQAFGGWSFDRYDKETKERVGHAYGTEFILQVLRTLEVTSWEKLPGTHCRARHTYSKIEAIGHILKDQWFNPDVLTSEMEEII